MRERSGRRLRYALCGLSNRGLALFALPLLGRPLSGRPSDDMSPYGQLVAIVDVDPVRVARFNEQISNSVPYFQAEEFDRMVDTVQPDTVVIASPDHTHAEYAVAALKRDIPVITEKPMAASCVQVRAMLDAERASSARIRVAHNLRYAPRHRAVRAMLLDGAIGRITSADLVWSVDAVHGASYFRRWNRQRQLSGGLSVHKSCHHLDLINWFFDDVPEQVFAYGALNYYGPRSPHNPSTRDGVAYSTREQMARCSYHALGVDESVGEELDGRRAGWYGLPYDAQYPASQPLYIYDEAIDVEDTYSAVIRYRHGASLTYSISFSGPWEGYRLGINGTDGRLECCSMSFRDTSVENEESATITYFPLFGQRQVLEVAGTTAEHGGADPLLRQDLFSGASEESRRLSIAADSRQGAYAVAAGEAMWRSVCDNRPYALADLLGEGV